MKPKTNPFLRPAALAASVVLTLGFTKQHASAVSATWGADADGAWATGGSWSGGTAAGSATAVASTDVATFDGAGNYAVGLGGGSVQRHIGTIDITNTGTTTFNNGGYLYVYDSITMSATAGAVNIGNSLRLNGTTANTITNDNTASLLTINAVGRSVSGSATVTIGGAGNTMMSGAIVPASGSLAFTKVGAGTLTLSGNNTFNGGVTLKAGTINIDTNNSAFGTGTFQIGDSTGITAVTLDSLSARSITNALRLYQDFTYTGTNTLNQGTGAITLASNGTTGNRIITVSASTLTLGGIIGDGGSGYSITKTGAGTLTLSSGASTYSGGTYINAGTVSLGASSSPTSGTVTSGPLGTGSVYLGGGTLKTNNTTLANNIVAVASTSSIIDSTGNATLNGNLSGSGTITKTSANQIVLGGNNSSFAGTFTENSAGTGPLNFSTANSGSALGKWVQGAASTWVAGANSITVKLGELSSTVTTGTVRPASAVSAGNQVTFEVGELGTDATYSGKITDYISSGTRTANVTKVGSGNWTLTNTNTYTGETRITDGKLTLTGSGSIASSAKLVVNGTLDVSGIMAGTFTVGGTQTLSGIGTITATGKTLEIAGTHAVGNSPGLQTVDGNLSYTSTSIFEWDLAANVNGVVGTRGTDFDAVDVSGDLTIDSAATFKVIQNAGVDFTDTFWTSNQSWSNIWSVTGTPTSGWADSAVAVYNTSNVLQDVSTYGSFSISGTSLTWTAVPELSNVLIGGLLGACVLRRRRK